MDKYERKQVVLRTAQRFLETPSGSIVPLAQLSLAAGVDLAISTNRWAISEARKMINREHGLVFATVRKEGYRRVERDDGAVFAGAHGLRAVRRRARTTMRTADNAARFANGMTAEQRRRHNQQMASLGLIDHLSMDRTVRSLPDEPAKTDPLDGLRAVLGVS